MPLPRRPSAPMALAFVIALSSCSGSAAAPEILVDPRMAGDHQTTIDAEAAVDPDVAAALERLVDDAATGLDLEDLDIVGESRDVRLAWLVTDLLRLLAGTPEEVRLVRAFTQLTGEGVDPFAPWPDATNHLMAMDYPAPPGYLELKRRLFLLVDPRWQPLFEEGRAVDWRHVSWGGVLIDDRPAGATEPCATGCIPALDDPGTTDAEGGSWYADDRIVFGVVVNGDARAYPRNQMEVHEMVNDTLGGRRIGVPYCTLCSSAQAYYLDDLGGFSPTLRTSGLLVRSNKMMYDLETMSLIDTVTGEATTGPLADAGVTLTPISVVTSTWGEWRAEHPDTTIVAQDGGIGRSYADNPLGDRDADGPIFPIGEADPRLAVQEAVLGFRSPDGKWVAVQVEAAHQALTDGRDVTIAGASIVAAAGGLAVEGPDGPIPSHQAFWFAWSQFHPDTLLWTAP